MSDGRRVVITGLGVVSPIGVGVADFWDALIDRRSGIRRIDVFDPATLPSRIGATIPALKIADYVPKTYRKSVKLMSRDIELAVVAAHQAALDARLPTRCLVERGDLPAAALESTRLGANIGAGLICPDLNELGAAFVTGADAQGSFDLRKWGSEGMDNLTPLWLLKFLPNMLACHVTIVHDAQAMSNTITCAEASSHLAIGEAYRNIARGRMDVCLCGGAESKMNPMGVARPALMKRLVVNGDTDPALACRPFAADRAGTVAAEGGGLVVLESLEHAQARGARIYAELIGFGAAANTFDWAKPDPNGADIAHAIRSALRDAGVTASDIDLFATFGCGTPEHDAAESKAWRSVFGDRSSAIPALAIKGLIGNNGAGSGALDFCAAVMAMYKSTVPPSANTHPTDPDCPLRFATDDPIDHNVAHAVSASYALSGGQSAALVIKRFEERSN